MESSPILSGRFLRLTVANFCFFMTFATFFLLPLHVRALGGSDQTVGFVMGSLGVLSLVGVFVVGLMIDRVGCRIFLRTGLLGMSLVSLSFAFVDQIVPWLFILRGLQGLFFACGFNSASTLAAAYAPPERRATALGFFGVSTLTTHALAPTLGEQILRFASFQVLFAVASGPTPSARRSSSLACTTSSANARWRSSWWRREGSSGVSSTSVGKRPGSPRPTTSPGSGRWS